ncbi:MAG TPA: nitroreductase family protein [Bacteroidales bacterium]|nr:nitroreductase family protein [Bacteroidales bacterium]
MQKPAITPLDLHPIIKNRWSPRSFDKRAVEPEKLQRVFEAARWSPSSHNEQPWRFFAGLKADSTWEKILQSLVEWNRLWAREAPVLILAMGKKTLTKTGEPNNAFRYDTGQALAWLTAQAVHEGLVAHQMGGFSEQEARRLFEIPDDFEPLTVTAMGYQGPAENLAEPFKKLELAERSRKKASELVFAGKFGTASTWVE